MQIVKEKFLASALMVSSFFGVNSRAIAQTSTEGRAAAEAADTGINNSPDFKTQRDIWIKQGEEIGKVKFACELIEKSVAKITSQLNDISDPQIKKEWKEEIYPLVQRNLESTKKGLTKETPDTESLFTILDTTMLLIGKWSEKLLSRQVNNLGNGSELLPGISAGSYSLGLYNPIAMDMYLQVRPEAQQMLGALKGLMNQSMEKLTKQYDPAKTAGENIRDIGMKEAKQSNEFSRGYRVGTKQGEAAGYQNGFRKGKKEGYDEGVRETELKYKN